MEQYHNTLICMKIIRTNYLIIQYNTYGLIFVDYTLNIVKELFLFKDIYISDIYIKSDESEILLNCMFPNKCLVKISMHDFSYDIIDIDDEDHEMWLSRVYYWESDYIILVGNTGFLVKVDLKEKKYQFITMRSLNVLAPIYTKFLKHMKKNCKAHVIALDYGPNFFFIKYVDYKRYIYVCRDPEEEHNYVVDYVKNEKMILSTWDDEDYTFDYNYGFFVTTQEYKVEVFYNKKSILTLNTPKRVYFGAKLFQDLNHRYLLVLDGCTLTNKDVKLTRYTLPTESSLK